MYIQNTKELKRKLMNWYRKNKRDLPWRSTADPYEIWVSEIMLQQTQVTTVIPYYKRFLSRFPTYVDLARSNIQEVFAEWQGLGYYRRAKHLHQAAQLMYKNGFPDNYSEWIKMPGVGTYTAGAIASLAYNERVPAVDGNVVRVLSRINCLNSAVPTLISECGTISKMWMGRVPPREWNQALMELGATICKTIMPNCTICPVHDHCKAFQQNKQTEYPKKRVKTTLKPLIHIVECPMKGKQIGLIESGHDKWWNGLWTFRRHEFEGNQDIHYIIGTLDIGNSKPFAKYKHIVTNHKITAIAFLTKQLPKAASWISLDDVDKIALPSPDRFFVNEIKKLTTERSKT